MPFLVVVGLGWGDEGKGRVISALKDEFDIVARFQGGSNAGHTVLLEGKKIVFHQLPSGLIHKDKIGILGPYELIDIEFLLKEIEELEKMDLEIMNRIYIDERCPLVLPFHKFIDQLEEEKKGVGTTQRGIGPGYSEFVIRKGIRLCDLKNEETLYERFKISFEWSSMILGGRYGQVPPDKKIILKNLKENFEKIKERITDTVKLIHESEKNNKRILIEGAQGMLLDIVLGTYPYVTSSFTTAGGASASLGIPPYKIKRIIGVLKFYATRVGKGPFPTECEDKIGMIMREKGEEYGATTLRPRRCGWLDLVASKYACIVNGPTEIALTKIDILSGINEIKICVEYEINGERTKFPPVNISEWFKIKPIYKTFEGFEIKSDIKNYQDLPKNLRKIIDFIEEYLEVPIRIISLGKEKSQIVYK